MAIRTFCTTFCTVLATLSALPATAFEMLPETSPVTAGIANRGNAAAPHAAGRVLFESDAPIGMTGPDQGSTSLLNQTGTYVGGLVAGDIAYRPHALTTSEPEQGNLPLLGAAAIALLVAQLRRSRRPAVR
ncbi:hypothetical protein [Pseudoduganella lutea]|uniref:PEP-CTERM sorting domain-containing protein n=1 Tax=Pseudoduganella lutea TaxID=321985 RepID=A0A4P6KYD3_9BURK|nr:hypothetical protein [Pseudoduganella lutea]QBE63308.1 hypothetical protein EWM63_10320 [Pseudoduganella lutea]